ncbi:MAG: NAD(P)(+) transhydrogenase (Re/Si-specific) subunit beta [Lewinellaceae bacterium]|nr:NAD(P)(+) transhydrogenase (Re/Si-specific) subunit beta [Saprospiraceae bacterium]MCB9341643.1 NAD(P)(+) transhydrogenase (Re/Si-specific) subunit beta [Lewinellaceae bacterium]
MSEFLLELFYIVGCVTFIIGLRKLSSPDSARQGNNIAAAGMTLAILGTILFHKNEAGEGIGNLAWIVGGLVVGSAIGYVMATRVKMTAMPQMVSFFNGTGGATSAIIACMEFFSSDSTDWGFLLVAYLGIVVGTVTFSGSMVAYGKLDDKIKDVSGRLMTYLNWLMLAVILVLMTMGILSPETLGANGGWILLGLSFLYGIFFVMPIGGADMPVVIALLNSLSGIAGAFGGLIYSNRIMLIGGILVGASGLILTALMCKAMNRSLMNVLIGGFGGGSAGSAKASGEQSYREVTLNDAAIMCAYASKVCIVPGYGLAVAQAQHVCHDFEKSLEKKGVEVYYAIHPVAGRMPGHMNVLLAEADVPYPKLVEMDDANPQMPNTDVVIIVGANDVVNPAAEDDPGSPIYGMPVIKVWEAKSVIVMKRSMRPGYAGIENPLFFHERAKMLFGDAKDTLSKLVGELKNL